MKATSRPLEAYTDAPLDLNDVAGDNGVLFVRGGTGLAGRGVAARVPIDDAAEVLRSIEHNSTVEGAAPVAIGAVPFEPGAAAELLIPAVTVVKRGENVWVTVIDDADVEAALTPPPEPVPAAPPRPGRSEMHSPPSMKTGWSSCRA